MQSSKVSFPRSSLVRLTMALAIAAILISILAIILTLSFGSSMTNFVIVGSMWSLFLIPFSFLDCWRRMGWKKTLIFIGLVAGLCFPAEYLGSKYGLLFGSYVYSQENVWLMILNQVPLRTIILAWWFVVYLAFATTNTLAGGFLSNESFPSGTGSTLVKARRGRIATVLWLPSLAAVDGLIATNLDIIIDPVFVDILDRWTWHNVGSNYYGIPFSNFASWFVLVFLISLIFRSYLWASSSSDSKARIANPSPDSVLAKTSAPSWLEYVPPLLYFAFQLQLSTVALQTHHPEYAFVGIATTSPVLLIAILLFQARKRSQRG